MPQTLLVNGIMNYVYEGPYAQPLALRIPGGLKPGTRLPVSARLEWLECTRTLCVPASARLALTLVVAMAR